MQTDRHLNTRAVQTCVKMKHLTCWTEYLRIFLITKLSDFYVGLEIMIMQVKFYIIFLNLSLKYVTWHRHIILSSRVFIYVYIYVYIYMYMSLLYTILIKIKPRLNLSSINFTTVCSAGGRGSRDSCWGRCWRLEPPVNNYCHFI